MDEVYPKARAYQVLASLVFSNDLEAVDAVLDNSVFFTSDSVLLWEVGKLLQEVLEDYSFTNSPRFASEIHGKSEEFSAMRVKLESAPTKREGHLEDLRTALFDLPVSEIAYSLVSLSKHGALDEIRAKINLLSNPD
jgi:hypothetical protein